MFRVYMVKDNHFFVQVNNDEIIKMSYPPVDIKDKDAFAHAIVDELNRQHA